MTKYQPVQKYTGKDTGPVLTEKQMEAHKSNPHSGGKYTYREVKIKEPKAAPKEAEKASKD